MRRAPPPPPPGHRSGQEQEGRGKRRGAGGAHGPPIIGGETALRLCRHGRAVKPPHAGLEDPQNCRTLLPVTNPGTPTPNCRPRPFLDREPEDHRCLRFTTGPFLRQFLRLAIVTVSMLGGPPSSQAQGHSLRIEVEHRFKEQPLVLNASSLTNEAGNRFSVTRLDYLLSELSLKRADGSWLDSRDWFAYMSPTTGRTTATTKSMPAENFTGIRFKVGVPPQINAADPNQYGAAHELHPQVNGLHWGWQGGYVFLALEGNYQNADGSTGGYSYHVANDENLMSVELPVTFDTRRDTTLTLAFEVSQIFDRSNRIDIANQLSTHSRKGDALAAKLKANIEGAFQIAMVDTELFHPPSSVQSARADLAGEELRARMCYADRAVGRRQG